MSAITWNAGIAAENAAMLPDDEYQRHAAWRIHRFSSREEILQAIVETADRLRRPEREGFYEQNYDRPAYDNLMTAKLRILQMAIAVKGTEAQDPRYQRLYTALENVEARTKQALESTYEAGVDVDLTSIRDALDEAFRAQQG